MRVQLDIPRTPTARDHFRVKAVCQVENFLLAFHERGSCRLDVVQIDNLNLPDQYGIGRLGDEAAMLPDQFRCRTQRGDDRRLLHCHGHHVSPAVDHQVHPQAQRKADDTDNVFHHLVGGGEIQRMPAACQRAEVTAGDDPALMHRANAFGDAQLVELGNPASIFTHRSTVLTSRPCGSMAKSIVS